MAIIARPPASISKKAITVRMPEPIAQTLHEYASFLGSSLDHIVIEALKLVFKKDTEFKEWRDRQPSSAPDVPALPESTPAVPLPLFAESKRDGHRATGEKSRES